MNFVFDALKLDDRCGMVDLKGGGDTVSSGLDLKDFVRAASDQ